MGCDPRFPFFRVSRAIDEVHRGEGRRIDAYLQLPAPQRKVVREVVLALAQAHSDQQQRTVILLKVLGTAPRPVS